MAPHRIASKAFLYFKWELQQYNSNSTSIPVLTSLEEEVVPGYIQFAGHLAQGGAIPHGIQWNHLMDSSSMQNWGWTEPTCQPGAWSGWHINPYTHTSAHRASRRAKTCWGEREGAIPHEDHCRSALDLIWSPPLVKDLSDPVNLLQIWLIQSNRLSIHWFIDFGFAPLFINLLIKIINNWFFGISDLSDGKSLKTRK